MDIRKDYGFPASLSKYGKQKYGSMLILSGFNVKFVLQYSTDVGNIFYICVIIVRRCYIMMKVFLLSLNRNLENFTA